MTIMRVWQAYHQDGRPWKVWAAVIEGGGLYTRWGSAGQNLCSPKAVDLKGASASAALAKAERSKEDGPDRYRFMGEFDVSDAGEIDWENEGGKTAAAQPAPAPKFFSMRAKMDLTAIQQLRSAGYQIDVINTESFRVLAPSGAGFWINKDGDKLQAAVKTEEMTAALALVMAFLAKNGTGAMVGPDGMPIATSFKGLCEHLASKEMEAVRETAELLGLAPRDFSKALKVKSGLFSFGSSQQQST